MYCYVNNPKSGVKIPASLTLDNTLFYPEKAMTTYERHTSGVPSEFNIMTDAPELVALYDREEVFIWCKDRERWVHPDIQTYAADIMVIRQELFGINSAIPRATIDGKITNIMGHGIKPKS